MKSIEFQGVGDPSVIAVVDAPVPEVRPGDVLIRVHAAGVNRADLLQRKGYYGARPDFGDSVIPGLEVAGEVVSAGAGAARFKAGDRVMAIVGGGAYAEFARVDARMCMPIPGRLSYTLAAAIPEVFVTAHEALHHLGALQAGDWVLIHGAGGGVGSAAIQLAHATAARIVYTASGAALERVAEIGGDAGVDYRQADFLPAVQAATDGRGVDVVVDFVGGPYLERNIRALAPGGRLIQVGALGGSKGTLPVDLVIHNYLRIIGTVMKSRTLDDKIAMTERFASRWLDGFETGTLTPLVDRVFALEDTAEAHRYMETSGRFGKIILAMD